MRRTDQHTLTQRATRARDHLGEGTRIEVENYGRREKAWEKVTRRGHFPGESPVGSHNNFVLQTEKSAARGDRRDAFFDDVWQGGVW